MLRLIHPASGEVLIGGVPIRVLSREDIGTSIGYVQVTALLRAWEHGTGFSLAQLVY